jgi:hypothetical protein
MLFLQAMLKIFICDGLPKTVLHEYEGSKSLPILGCDIKVLQIGFKATSANSVSPNLLCVKCITAYTG